MDTTEVTLTIERAHAEELLKVARERKRGHANMAKNLLKQRKDFRERHTAESIAWGVTAERMEQQLAPKVEA